MHSIYIYCHPYSLPVYTLLSLFCAPPIHTPLFYTIPHSSVGMDYHTETIEKMQEANRLAAKVARKRLREIAQLLAFKHLNTSPLDPVACVHREDGDNEFMNTLANELVEKGILVLVSVGGEKGGGNGQFLLAGSEHAVAELGPR